MSMSKATDPIKAVASPYIGDPKLYSRVKKCLENESCATNSSENIANYLQLTYSEYSRKKKNAFRKSVLKAYDLVKKDFSSATSIGDTYDELEFKHLKKRKLQQSHNSDQASESDEFSEDNENYKEYKDTNSLNKLITGLQKNRKNSYSAPPSASSSPRRVEETVQVPGLGKNLFFIDKTGTSSKNNSTKLESDNRLNFVKDASTPKSNVSLTNNDTNEKSVVESFSENNDLSTINTAEQLITEVKNTTENKSNLKEENKDETKTDGKRKRKFDRDSKKKTVKTQMSTATFADVGGSDDILKEVCKLLIHMKHPEVYHQLGITPPRGFLLHGPPGCGKTLLANAIAGELGQPMIKISAPEIVSGVSGESEEKLRDLFESAESNSPCVLFIDEIDSICQKRENASKDMERRIVAQLLTCLDELNDKTECQVLVIGATNRPDTLDPALRRAGRFDREICMGIPGEQARQRILEVLCRGLNLEENFDFLKLARNSPGYVGADLMSLSREAAITAVNRVFATLQQKKILSDSEISENKMEVVATDKNEMEVEIESAGKSVVNTELVETAMDINSSKKTFTQTEDTLQSVLHWLKEQPPLSPEELSTLFITMSDFEVALKKVQPSAKREGFATVPNVTWDDIGALQNIREELQMAILAPVHHPEQFQCLGLTNPPGILLAGPPGCGKTLLAKAIANESGLNFISVKGPELLNMYVGESERAVRQVFQRARNSAPCVIFFDELDALCPRRSSSGEGGSSVRVVNQLLTEMDGLEERKKVFIMGATNRPDIIDPAILRPGRLDKQLYVGLPNVDDRLAILNTLTKEGTKPALSTDVSLQDIAADPKCDCLTGADLSGLVREASVIALKEFMTSDKHQKQKVLVSRHHFEAALKKTKPSVSKQDLLIYSKMSENLSTT